MHSEIRAYFILSGPDLEPDAVTAAVGIVPSRSWRRGDARRVVDGVYSYGAWVVDSTAPASEGLAAHIASVMKQLEGRVPALSESARGYEAGLQCVVSSYSGDRPAITFEPDTVRRMAALGAWIDVDLYVLNGDTEG